MNTYHIFSEGDLVLFRDRSDKIFFNNKFAAACYNNSVEALGTAIQSTHIHDLVSVDNVSQLEAMAYSIKKSYGLFYSHKYGVAIGNNFRISYSLVSGKEKILEKLIYVMTNQVHHYVMDSPFKDQFSSANYVFTDEYLPINFRMALTEYVTRFDELPARRQKELLNNDKVPGHYLVDREGFILPNSYINVQKVRAFFNYNYNYFRYLIDTTVRDIKKNLIDANRQAVLCDGLDDEVVCREIDSFAKACGRRSFHYLSDSELVRLLDLLHSKGVPSEQCRRCLWLKLEKKSF